MQELLRDGCVNGRICTKIFISFFILPGYHDGCFTVQDPSTAIAVDLLDPQPGESIIDVCAAPGGKTGLIVEKMNNEGSLTAVDIHDDRVALLHENAERLGWQCVEIVKGNERSKLRTRLKA